MMSSTLLRNGSRLISSGLVPLLLVLGLMMAPVSCTCGASVPHGHSLFQLPSHNHSADDSQDRHGEDHESPGVEAKVSGYQPHPLLTAGNDCDELERSMTFSENFALSNALEHQGGAVLQAPPSSSIGQPMVIAQPPALVGLVSETCEPLTLPVARILEGTDTSPEIPPPRA